MIEFNETFTQKYGGKEAVAQRIRVRAKHTPYDIPYYERGLDVEEFRYGSQVAAIKLAFKDFGPEVRLDKINSRVQYYDVSVDLDVDEESGDGVS